MSTFQLVVDGATAFLEQCEAFSREKSQSGSKIVDALSLVEGINLKRGSLFNYLSSAANDPANSQIVSGGPRSGYWLEKIVATAEVAEKEKTPTPKGKKKETNSEKSLYPLIELWLSTKGYRSKDTSTAKSGGKWGNPDIIGLNRIQAFGISDIEIASCEVKLSIANWETFIFEAISHKRFSNRSFYCFRDDREVEIPPAIQYYAEKFRIGIVQIILDEKEIESVKGAGGDFKKLEQYLTNIVEIFPALFDVIPAQEKVLLLDRLGIKDEKSFYGFGSEY